ncbi:MAG: pyocin activator PrtN family protein [Acinetobacter sp.]|uniref:pyocin activator PrtN family protein n=1 Tax=Acinetobacter sp. TaxID=472 RepID=UPI0025847814|nr:pyocin activator PrtN family protein [Acinetobacter sp.]MCE1270317.1 pyocin activator PrtN family protein [Acinetobacter sp.]
MDRLSTVDYLFLKFRSVYIKLEVVSKEFYPTLGRDKMLEKARQQKFPFTCFRMDESQKGEFFVDIHELARVLDEIYVRSYQSFKAAMQKSTKSKE